MKPRCSFLVLGLAAIFFLGGCAHLFSRAEAPRVNIANITPKDVKLFEQVFAMELRVMNPTDKEIGYQGARLRPGSQQPAFCQRGIESDDHRRPFRLPNFAGGRRDDPGEPAPADCPSPEGGVHRFHLPSVGLLSNGFFRFPDSVRRDGGVQTISLIRCLKAPRHFQRKFS